MGVKQCALACAVVVFAVFAGTARAERVVGYQNGAGQIVSSNLDGSDVQVVGPGYDSAHASDLGRVVFRYAENGNPAGIGRAYLNGFGFRALTNDPLDADPDIARDSGLVVFRRWVNDQGDIWAMWANGLNQHPLTTNAADEEEPALSPDGTKVAFWRGPSADGSGGVVVMNVDGTDEHLVFAGPGRRPDWSPDGTRLAIEVPTGSEGRQQIWNVASNGDDLSAYTFGDLTKVVTSDPTGAFAPRFSPDGSQILFSSARDNDFRSYLVGVDGANEHPAGQGTPVFADFAPDIDTTPPIVELPTPAEGAQVVLGDTAFTGGFGCGDNESGMAFVDQDETVSCLFLEPWLYPSFQLDTSTLGEKSITLFAQNYAGLTTTLVRHYSVVAQVNSTTKSYGAAFTATTGATATADDPVSTTVAVPVGGQATISEGSTTTGTPPAGYAFFGQQVDISVLDISASPPQPLVRPDTDPLRLTFVLDSTLLGTTDPATVQVFRDGAAIADCTGAAGVASPDPCIASRTADAAGDVTLSVLTTHASRWNFGKRTYVFRGFFAPVDNQPVVNVAKAGSAIPVKFSLGGNRGLAVLAAGYPRSQQIACDASAASDTIEQTVTAGASALSYDASTDQYTYVWKTDKTWSAAPAGPCRQLVLLFADGTERRASFRFGK